jgi:hypothetical protein
VARLTTPTDRGAFLDITLDFLFYASVPLAFALADPARQRAAGGGAAGGLHRHRVELPGLCACWPSAAA